MLRAPGSALSTVTCSVAALGDGGHGGDMAGSEEQSAPMAMVARRHGRAWGERGKRQGLTANPVEATARLGRDWSSRIPEEFAGGQRLKTMPWTTLHGFRRGAARWRGRGRHGGAPRHVGEARGRWWPRWWRTAATNPFG